jgi:hypothetical protein
MSLLKNMPKRTRRVKAPKLNSYLHKYNLLEAMRLKIQTAFNPTRPQCNQNYIMGAHTFFGEYCLFDTEHANALTQQLGMQEYDLVILPEYSYKDMQKDFMGKDKYYSTTTPDYSIDFSEITVREKSDK